jgi:hypothetical protein
MSDQRALVISVLEPRSLGLIFTPQDEERLRGQYRIVEAVGPTLSKTVADHIAEACSIIGQPDLSTELLQKAKNLKTTFNVESNFLDNMCKISSKNAPLWRTI